MRAPARGSAPARPGHCARAGRHRHFPTASEAKDPLKAKKRAELATEREERKRTSSSAGEPAAKRSRPAAATAKTDDFLELADATSVAVIVPFRDLHEAQKRAEHVKLFVPHMHNGPYIIWFGTSDTLFIGFPIRELESVAPSFDNSTFVNRCKALADENRLSILKALATADSLSTVEIIDRFDLEKSAASRHLRQLVATSLISEERIDKAKKGYRLNHQIVSECIDALRQLL